MTKLLKLSAVLVSFTLSALFVIPAFADKGDIEYAPDQKVMTLAEYLEISGEEWFHTGKKEYRVQAMMVSKETSFHNDLEVTDYTVTDDGITVILKGTADELWTSKLEKVKSTYIKPDGSPVSEADFAEKDVFIDLITIPSPDSNYAMFVPKTISVSVETAWGSVLHTNLPNAPHGDGDFLVCRVGEDGKPDLSDVWVLNGVLFPQNYDTTHFHEEPETKDEGIDTICEVSFSPYSGNRISMFLSEGDRIAVISPSALPSREQVEAVIEGLKQWGYVPVEGKHVFEETRTLEDCIADLKWALEDPSIKGIFCVRGGYGSSEVMDKVDPELIASAGKLIIGYSDITVFHSAWTTARLLSVHSSMSAAFIDLPEECAEAEKKILKGEIPSYNCKSGPYNRNGEAEGILIGGNLSTLTAVLGTPYDCTQTARPYILFLEDVGEDLQHIHRYMTILKHLGILDRAAGILFGEWTELPAEENDYSGNSRGGKFMSVADMISREFPELSGIPVAFGFPAGHGDVNYPLLMGETVRFTVSKDSFTLEWKK